MFRGMAANRVMCPNCTSDSCRRSHRKNMRDCVFSWVGIRPFRCKECQVRFWRSGDRLSFYDARAPLVFYLIIFFAHIAMQVGDLISALKKGMETSLIIRRTSRGEENAKGVI
jgi:transposase-like protein